MKIFKITIAALPFLFIIWVMVSADLGASNFFVDFVHSFPYGDKVGHVFVFGTLTLVLSLATKLKRLKIYYLRPLLAAIVVFIFAVIEEVSQLAFKTRTFDLADVLCDIVGIILFGYLSIYLVETMRKYASRQ